mmetsp:Transcript_42417/g.91105  ORF Transcript_42417/g.91105 Transcript_42417/m.91105 type:complete len:94 (+) Transcript_42417:414-695(+)
MASFLSPSPPALTTFHILLLSQSPSFPPPPPPPPSLRWGLGRLLDLNFHHLHVALHIFNFSSKAVAFFGEFVAFTHELLVGLDECLSELSSTL